jgi:hypothetical protein
MKLIKLFTHLLVLSSCSSLLSGCILTSSPPPAPGSVPTIVTDYHAAPIYSPSLDKVGAKALSSSFSQQATILTKEEARGRVRLFNLIYAQYLKPKMVVEGSAFYGSDRLNSYIQTTRFMLNAGAFYRLNINASARSTPSHLLFGGGLGFTRGSYNGKPNKPTGNVGTDNIYFWYVGKQTYLSLDPYAQLSQSFIIARTRKSGRPWLQWQMQQRFTAVVRTATIGKDPAYLSTTPLSAFDDRNFYGPPGLSSVFTFQFGLLFRVKNLTFGIMPQLNYQGGYPKDEQYAITPTLPNEGSKSGFGVTRNSFNYILAWQW